MEDMVWEFIEEMKIPYIYKSGSTLIMKYGNETIRGIRNIYCRLNSINENNKLQKMQNTFRS